MNTSYQFKNFYRMSNPYENIINTVATANIPSLLYNTLNFITTRQPPMVWLLPSDEEHESVSDIGEIDHHRRYSHYRILRNHRNWGLPRRQCYRVHRLQRGLSLSWWIIFSDFDESFVTLKFNPLGNFSRIVHGPLRLGESFLFSPTS